MKDSHESSWIGPGPRGLPSAVLHLASWPGATNITVIAEVRDAVTAIADLVDQTRTLMDALSDGRAYPKKNGSTDAFVGG